MSTFLFLYNPLNWKWDKIEEAIQKVEKEGSISDSWTCMSKKPKNGDKFFLMQVGQQKNNGIFGSGSIDRLEEDVAEGVINHGLTNRAYIKINILLNPNEKKLDENTLKNKFPNTRWTPPRSGNEIDSNIVDDLENLWVEFVNNSKAYIETGFINKEYLEGNSQQRLFTVYERNSEARQACIDHYGYDCQICGTNLEKIYGEVGKDFIHVHHIDFFSNFTEEHKIDPIKDLITICPNCHAMLHRKVNGKYLTINQLKEKFVN
jgi:5-methylcytosine-specific restriction protein A